MARRRGPVGRLVFSLDCEDAATRVLAALRSVSRPDDLGGGDLLPVHLE